MLKRYVDARILSVVFIPNSVKTLYLKPANILGQKGGVVTTLSVSDDGLIRHFASYLTYCPPRVCRRAEICLSLHDLNHISHETTVDWRIVLFMTIPKGSVPSEHTDAYHAELVDEFWRFAISHQPTPQNPLIILNPGNHKIPDHFITGHNGIFWLDYTNFPEIKEVLKNLPALTSSQKQQH